MSKASQFIQDYKSNIINATLGTGVFPSVKMAQMILESCWGRAKIGNNMFGIKAKGKSSPYWDGSATETKTTEFINGVSGKYKEPFRIYASVEDSIRDHSNFLKVNPRYKKAGLFDAKTPEEQAQVLQAAGYATDPEYSNKLISLITQYNLKELDVKKKRIKLLVIGTLALLIVIAVILLVKTIKK